MQDLHLSSALLTAIGSLPDDTSDDIHALPISEELRAELLGIRNTMQGFPSKRVDKKYAAKQVENIIGSILELGTPAATKIADRFLFRVLSMWIPNASAHYSRPQFLKIEDLPEFLTHLSPAVKPLFCEKYASIVALYMSEGSRNGTNSVSVLEQISKYTIFDRMFLIKNSRSLLEQLQSEIGDSPQRLHTFLRLSLPNDPGYVGETPQTIALLNTLLNTAINSVDDLGTVLRGLPAPAMRVVLHQIKDKLPRIIQGKTDLDNLLLRLSLQPTLVIGPAQFQSTLQEVLGALAQELPSLTEATEAVSSSTDYVATLTQSMASFPHKEQWIVDALHDIVFYPSINKTYENYIKQLQKSTDGLLPGLRLESRAQIDTETTLSQLTTRITIDDFTSACQILANDAAWKGNLTARTRLHLFLTLPPEMGSVFLTRIQPSQPSEQQRRLGTHNEYILLLCLIPEDRWAHYQQFFLPDTTLDVLRQKQDIFFPTGARFFSPPTRQCFTQVIKARKFLFGAQETLDDFSQYLHIALDSLSESRTSTPESLQDFLNAFFSVYQHADLQRLLGHNLENLPQCLEIICPSSESPENQQKLRLPFEAALRERFSNLESGAPSAVPISAAPASSPLSSATPSSVPSPHAAAPVEKHPQSLERPSTVLSSATEASQAAPPLAADLRTPLLGAAKKQTKWGLPVTVVGVIATVFGILTLPFGVGVPFLIGGIITTIAGVRRTKTENKAEQALAAETAKSPHVGYQSPAAPTGQSSSSAVTQRLVATQPGPHVNAVSSYTSPSAPAALHPSIPAAPHPSSISAAPTTQPSLR